MMKQTAVSSPRVQGDGKWGVMSGNVRRTEVQGAGTAELASIFT